MEALDLARSPVRDELVDTTPHYNYCAIIYIQEKI